MTAATKVASESGLACAANALLQASSVLIAVHADPDGDAIGSALGLARAVEMLGKPAVVVSQDPVPEVLRGLPAWHAVQVGGPGGEPLRDALGVVIDCPTLERAGDSGPAVAACARRLKIDHHREATPFPGTAWVDTGAAATAEMVALLLPALGVQPDAELAACLLVGLILDTGGLQRTGVTPRTLRVAADLAEAGVSIPALIERYYLRRPAAEMRLYGLGLSRVATAADGKVAWVELSAEDFRRLRVSIDAADELANDLGRLEGVELSLLIRPGREDLRVSVRSWGDADAGALAAQFGGGGHRQRAGCHIPDTPNARRELIDAARAACGSS